MDPADPSFASLLPALVAIGLAFVTRQVLLSLFLGVVTGGLALAWQTGDPSKANIVQVFLLPALGSSSYATILVIYLWCLGGLVGMWEKTGAALHFARVVGARIAKGPTSSLVFAWLVGLVFHQGGTVSTVLTGATVRPVADDHKVSHEELSYVVDSTASPVATILPFNAWPAYVAGLVVGTIPLFPKTDAGVSDAIAFFFRCIPYNFYAVFAVLSTLGFSAGWLPLFGKMGAARRRARETGALDAPGAQPMLPTGAHDPENQRVKGYAPSLWDFLLPLGVLLSLAVLPYLVFGRDLIKEAFAATVLTSMGAALARGMSLGDVMDGFVDGCKGMTIGAIILGLAVTMGLVAKELHTADYVVALIGTGFPPEALPPLLTLICMGIAFATGTSWGTYAVVFPVALPLAWAIGNGDVIYLQICFGAVIGGAVFGDQCSPISDTTILSSMFTGCDLMDHVNTQLPLALFAAGLAIVASTVAAFVLV